MTVLIKPKSPLKEREAGIDHRRIIEGAPVLRDLFKGTVYTVGYAVGAV